MVYLYSLRWWLCCGAILFPFCSSASGKASLQYSDLINTTNKIESVTSGTEKGKQKDGVISVTWSVNKGQDLRNVLSQWASMAGWDLVWNSEQSYKLLAAASFSNVPFEQAVSKLFYAIGNLDPKLYVSLYEKNKVMLVSSKPEF